MHYEVAVCRSNHLHAPAVCLAKEVGLECLVGRSEADHALPQEKNAVEVRRRDGKIVQGDNDRRPPEPAESSYHLGLSGDIQPGERLIQEHDLGFLCDGAGDEHSLLLAA